MTDLISSVEAKLYASYECEYRFFGEMFTGEKTLLLNLGAWKKSLENLESIAINLFKFFTKKMCLLWKN